MALIKCSECGREISDKAGLCPHCGCPKEYFININNSIRNIEKGNVSGDCLYIGNVAVTKKQMDEIENLIVLNKLTTAIRIVRGITGLNLAEANEFVDKFYIIDKTKPQNKFKKEKLSYNEDVTDESQDIPVPKISEIIIIGMATTICLAFALVFGTGSFIGFIVLFIIFLLVLRYLIRYIKDYNFAKNNYEEYKEKIMKERKLAKEREERESELEKVRKEAEQKRRQELYKRIRDCEEKGIATCPKCGSTSIATVNRGYSLVWGFVGSGKPINVCQVCGHKWDIKK